MKKLKKFLCSLLYKKTKYPLKLKEEEKKEIEEILSVQTTILPGKAILAEGCVIKEVVWSRN